MKNILFISLAFLVSLGAYSQSLKIGDKTHGGIVAYIDETGKYGLVCSLQNLGVMELEDAKNKCSELKIGGKDDWYLPSKYELNILYQNLHKKGIGGFTADYYWSSTEYDGVNTWSQNFNNGRLYDGSKANLFCVRAVRALTVFGFSEVLVGGGVVTDVDNNTYKTVKIGTQEWMSENLRTTRYSDGTRVSNVTQSSWQDLSTGAWSHYNNDIQYESTYGKLYNWYAVNTNKLCPIGWHVPTDAEWKVLTNYLSANGYKGTEGRALKSKSGWNNNRKGTGVYGWLGLPGGFRDGITFYSIGFVGYWWSSSEYLYVFGKKTYPSSLAWHRHLGYGVGTVYRSSPNKNYGFSVRCLRD